jgi:hypothetical protein
VGLADSRKVTKLTKNDLEVLSLFTFHFSPFTSPIPICVNLRSSAVCLTSAPLRENFFVLFAPFRGYLFSCFASWLCIFWPLA